MVLLGYGKLGGTPLPVEHLADRRGGEGGLVVGPGEMVEDHPAQAVVHQLGKAFGGFPVRQVAMASGHPLLQAPRIRAVAQHVEIVVRLEDHDVQVVQQKAIQFASSNKILGTGAILLPNSTNANTGKEDVVVGYLSRPYPKYAKRFSDYDHLARVKEWSLARADEDGLE